MAKVTKASEGTLSKEVAAYFKKSAKLKISLTTITFWEQLGFTILLSVLQQAHFDPAKAATLHAVLVPLGRDIMMLYPADFGAPPAP
jgi:hypothetical protein